MDVMKEVRALANRPESGHLVFSVYLDIGFRGEHDREAVRIFVKDRLKAVEKEHSGRRARWEHLAEDVTFIREYVDGVVAMGQDSAYRGLALFACAPEGLRTVLRSRLPFPNAFHLAPRPRIRPLAYLYDEYETAIFADVGQAGVSLYLIRAGEIEEHHRSEREAAVRPRDGMFSGPRHDRHAEDQVARFHRDVADTLVRLTHREEARNIVLSGQDHVVAAFRRHLPKFVDDQVVSVLALDRNTNRDGIVAATMAALRVAERAREEVVVRRLLDLRGNPSRAAVGFAKVLPALEQGRVHRLLLSDRLERQGFRCAACGRLGESPPESCELCGEPVISTDLVEAMVVAAIQRGAEVDEIVGHAEFEALGGVAALLRF